MSSWYALANCYLNAVQGLFCSRGLSCSRGLFCSYLLLFCSYLLLFCSPGTILFTQFEPTLAGTILFTGDYLVHVNRIVPSEQDSPRYSVDYSVHRGLSCSQATILFTTTVLHVHTSHIHSVHGDSPACSQATLTYSPVHVNRIVPGGQDSPHYSGDYPVHRGLSCSQATILFTCDYLVHRRLTILFTTTILHVHTSHMHTVFMATILFTGDLEYC